MNRNELIIDEINILEGYLSQFLEIQDLTSYGEVLINCLKDTIDILNSDMINDSSKIEVIELTCILHIYCEDYL